MKPLRSVGVRSFLYARKYLLTKRDTKAERVLLGLWTCTITPSFSPQCGLGRSGLLCWFSLNMK